MRSAHSIAAHARREEQLIKAREQQKRIAEVEWDVGREAEERRLFVDRKQQEREEQARAAKGSDAQPSSRRSSRSLFF